MENYFLWIDTIYMVYLVANKQNIIYINMLSLHYQKFRILSSYFYIYLSISWSIFIYVYVYRIKCKCTNLHIFITVVVQCWIRGTRFVRRRYTLEMWWWGFTCHTYFTTPTIHNWTHHSSESQDNYLENIVNFNTYLLHDFQLFRVLIILFSPIHKFFKTISELDSWLQFDLN